VPVVQGVLYLLSGFLAAVVAGTLWRAIRWLFMPAHN